MPSDPVALIGLAAALVTTLCWLPQVLRVARTRDTRSLSLPTYLALTFGIGLWLIYGVLLGDVPLIAANAVTICFTGFILAMKLRHG